MSTLSQLLRQVRELDPGLGADLAKQVQAIQKDVPFGLHFERHRPESVRLHGQKVHRGDKVHVLPERGSFPRREHSELWIVTKISRTNGSRIADLARKVPSTGEVQTRSADVEDLVVVAEFRDNIYPGLVQTGEVINGAEGDPFHTVINGENYHALKALTYTDAGSVDAIYIDPPYNTGARDWKYNNNYVESDDDYRHSKWLAFMERRLKVAKQLLNPEDSVLIVTIDEKECLRLGMLLEQTFPEARIQMVSSVVNPKGQARDAAFFRTDEYVFVVQFGASSPAPLQLPSEWKVSEDARAAKLRWAELIRSGSDTQREDRPNKFYPVYVRNSDEGPVFVGVGEPYFGKDRLEVEAPSGSVAVWPIRSDGSEGRWQTSTEGLRQLIVKGYARLGGWRGNRTSISYLKRGEQAKVDAGVFPVVGTKQDGSVVTDASNYRPIFIPGTQWRINSHNAEQGGTNLLKNLLPGRKFPFPKSLYAVEDVLRFFVGDKPDAIVLDFFAGSGTTAHAVMRLNRQDGGRRQCISITNNEVGDDEQRELTTEGLRQGDREWEKSGICDYVTKPRVTAAITGRTADGDLIKGAYKFTDEFPMSEGFEANARFFTLTYEREDEVNHNLAFSRVAPLLWLRAGAVGSIIETIPDRGWAIAEAYAVLFDVDAENEFIAALGEVEGLTTVYVVTSDQYAFQRVAARVSGEADKVHLYRSYLTNFQITTSE